LSKSDAVPKAEATRKAKAVAKAAGAKPLVLSAVSGDGVQDALRKLAEAVRAARSKRDTPEPRAAGWRP
jgi:GTP-binding protein